MTPTRSAPASGGPHIGDTCVAGASRGCVVVSSGVPTSLFTVINSLNGGNGICCGGSDVVVTVADATGGVPEPAACALMLVGFGGLGAALRQARRNQAAVAAVWSTDRHGGAVVS